jgi:hypothetical protein
VAPRSGAGWGDYACSALAVRRRSSSINKRLMDHAHDAFDLIEDLIVSEPKHMICARVQEWGCAHWRVLAFIAMAVRV